MVKTKKGEREGEGEGKGEGEGEGLGEVLLMDWEMVGFGWGPQECGQFMISHVEPGKRREIERRVFEESYVKVLLEELEKREVKVEVCNFFLYIFMFMFMYI